MSAQVKLATLFMVVAGTAAVHAQQHRFPLTNGVQTFRIQHPTRIGSPTIIGGSSIRVGTPGRPSEVEAPSTFVERPKIPNNLSPLLAAPDLYNFRYGQARRAMNAAGLQEEAVLGTNDSSAAVSSEPGNLPNIGLVESIIRRTYPVATNYVVLEKRKDPPVGLVDAIGSGSVTNAGKAYVLTGRFGPASVGTTNARPKVYRYKIPATGLELEEVPDESTNDPVLIIP